MKERNVKKDGNFSSVVIYFPISQNWMSGMGIDVKTIKHLVNAQKCKNSFSYALTYLKPSSLSHPHRVCVPACPPAAPSGLWGSPGAWWPPSLAPSLPTQTGQAPENHSPSYRTRWAPWSHRPSPPADLNWAQLHRNQTDGEGEEGRNKTGCNELLERRNLEGT